MAEPGRPSFCPYSTNGVEQRILNIIHRSYYWCPIRHAFSKPPEPFVNQVYQCLLRSGTDRQLDSPCNGPLAQIHDRRSIHTIKNLDASHVQLSPGLYRRPVRHLSVSPPFQDGCHSCCDFGDPSVRRLLAGRLLASITHSGYPTIEPAIHQDHVDAAKKGTLC